MNTKSVIVAVCLTIFCVSVNGKTNCDELGINFYDDIGCARENKGGDCPSYDNCTYEVPPGKCLYRGKVLENAEHIPNDGLCRFGCLCSVKENQKGTFICAQGQCGIFSPPPPGSKVECYKEYTLDSCCGNQRCEPSTATCEVDGITYKEGEKFYPNDECSVCICTPEFNGKYDGPHCKRRPCGTEIDHAAHIEANCAPVYYRNNNKAKLCCPSDFICPSSKDKITESGNTSGSTCRYGNKTINAGSTLTRDVESFSKIRKVTCECKVPPLLTCTGDI